MWSCCEAEIFRLRFIATERGIRSMTSFLQMLTRPSGPGERGAGVSVERLQLDEMPHGFGARGGWITSYDAWLTEIFANQ